MPVAKHVGIPLHILRVSTYRTRITRTHVMQEKLAMAVTKQADIPLHITHTYHAGETCNGCRHARGYSFLYTVCHDILRVSIHSTHVTRTHIMQEKVAIAVAKQVGCFDIQHTYDTHTRTITSTHTSQIHHIIHISHGHVSCRRSWPWLWPSRWIFLSKQ